MSVERFWCHEANNIRCVRESDYDALAQQLAITDALCEDRFNEIAELRALLAARDKRLEEAVELLEHIIGDYCGETGRRISAFLSQADGAKEND